MAAKNSILTEIMDEEDTQQTKIPLKSEMRHELKVFICICVPENLESKKKSRIIHQVWYYK